MRASCGRRRLGLLWIVAALALAPAAALMLNAGRAGTTAVGVCSAGGSPLGPAAALLHCTLCTMPAHDAAAPPAERRPWRAEARSDSWLADAAVAPMHASRPWRQPARAPPA